VSCTTEYTVAFLCIVPGTSTRYSYLYWYLVPVFFRTYCTTTRTSTCTARSKYYYYYVVLRTSYNGTSTSTCVRLYYVTVIIFVRYGKNEHTPQALLAESCGRPQPLKGGIKRGAAFLAFTAYTTQYSNLCRTV